jgi:IstB-like ATP binding protein
VFGDKAMTVAAIDRLVHHAVILEMNADSYRRKAAITRMSDQSGAATTTQQTADKKPNRRVGDN